MPTEAGERGEPTALTAFQIEVAQLFFTLPASKRFLLAGGAALLAQHLTRRPTRDLDLFTRQPGDVVTAHIELERAASERGWSIQRIQDTPNFCRLVVHGSEDLLIDLALDSPPQQAATASFVGPTFAPEELAGRKLLALFDRAEARDFADVFTLSQIFSKDQLLAQAAALDTGFDRRYLAERLASLRRFDDSEVPLEPQHLAELRAFFAAWRIELLC